MNLRFENVSFVYPAGVQALNGIDLVIPSGASIAVLGENGAGKTTLARHINGLLKPTAGTVWIGEWDTRQHTVAQLAHKVAYSFQNPDDQLFERTVQREVAFGPRNLGLTEAEIGKRVQQTLDWFGILAVAERHPYDLHPAQRKLVALASAVAMDTPILVIDEPTTGLDDREMARVGQVLDRLRAGGRTIIAISHDVDFCAEHFQYALVMSKGRMVGSGLASEVMAREALLRGAGVQPPQLVRLALALQLPGAPLSVDEFHQLLIEARRTGSR